jgi:hypothetical protein
MIILRLLRNVNLMFGFWVVAGILLASWKGVEVLPAVLVVAVLCLASAFWVMLRTWEGTVERIELRRVREEVVDAFTGPGVRWQQRLMADVRLADGRLLSIAASAKWQVGDHIVRLRDGAEPRDESKLRPAGS